MEAYFIDYLKILDQLHTDFKSALHNLPQEALDWTPGRETNSLAVLAVHTAGSLRYWVGDVIAADPSNRDRSAEFQSQKLDAPFLESRLDASLVYARAVLSKLTLADLNSMRNSPRHDNQLSCAWALLHALEHTAQHTAHAQLTRQLWDQRNPQQPA
jgi:uncharacterized damage-inducible protein DinB